MDAPLELRCVSDLELPVFHNCANENKSSLQRVGIPHGLGPGKEPHRLLQGTLSIHPVYEFNC